MIEHKNNKSAVDSLLNLKIDQLILESDLFRLCFLIPFMQAFSSKDSMTRNIPIIDKA